MKRSVHDSMQLFNSISQKIRIQSKKCPAVITWFYFFNTLHNPFIFFILLFMFPWSILENEASRYGRFLSSMLETASKWHKNKDIFEAECSGR